MGNFKEEFRLYPSEEVLRLQIEANRFSDNQIYIRGNVPSSKNSKRIFCRDGKGKCLKRPRLTDSELVKRYVNSTLDQWIRNKRKFLRACQGKDKPLEVKFDFIRDSNRLWDYTGPLETVLDCMSGQKFKNIKRLGNAWKQIRYIEDDDVKNIKPVLGEWWVDKETAGVIITVL